MTLAVLRCTEAFGRIESRRSSHLWYSNQGCRLPGHGKFVDAVGEAVVLERHLVERNGQAQVRYPAQQGVEDDLQFGARKLLTDALVPAVTEAELLACVAAEVELVGLRVGLRVPVGRGQIDDDAVTGPDGLA